MTKTGGDDFSLYGVQFYFEGVGVRAGAKGVLCDSSCPS